ncbi:unnamed protein product, partial [Meganyctiphanes norvegica]
MNPQPQITNFKSLHFHMDTILMEQSHKTKFEQYRKERNLKFMFHYLWKLDKAHSILNVDIKPPVKSKAHSENLRKQGNKFYQKKNFQQALDEYNKSIIVAPHPVITKGEYSAELPEVLEDLDMVMYKELALGYANRSAVLYELKQYKKSIADIDSALKFGYPQAQHHKLAERKAKCLIALKKHKEAKSLLEKTIATLSSLITEDTKKSLEKLEADCHCDDQLTSDGIYKDQPQRKLSSLSNDELLFAFTNPSPPILKEVNPKIPVFSSALDLSYSKSRGRSVIATRDIKPGEVLAVEAPYISMLISEDHSNLRNHCYVCTAHSLTPLPCAQCNKVIFCSDSCRDEGISKFHSVECSVLPTLLDLDMGMNGYLAFRVIARTPFQQLRSIVPK